MIIDVFRKMKNYPLLFSIPIVVDGLTVLLGVSIHGFNGSPHFTLKFVLQMGLPSISAVTEQTFMPGSVQISGSNMNTSSVIGILFFLVLFLVVQSFLKGGYIGLLHEATNEGRLSLESFAAYGMRCFSRFLMLDFLVLTLLFVFGGLATVVFNTLGFILFTFLFLWLRVMFLFLEFTLVVDNCSIREAFFRSLEAFHHRSSLTLLIVFFMICINVVFGLFINSLWLPLLFLVLIILYDIISAGFQFALMHDFQGIQGNLRHDDKLHY